MPKKLTALDERIDRPTNIAGYKAACMRLEIKLEIKTSTVLGGGFPERPKEKRRSTYYDTKTSVQDHMKKDLYLYGTKQYFKTTLCPTDMLLTTLVAKKLSQRI